MPRPLGRQSVGPEQFVHTVDEFLWVEREKVARRMAYILTGLIALTLVVCLTLMVLDALGVIHSLKNEWVKTIVEVIKWATGGSGLGAGGMYSWLFVQSRRGRRKASGEHRGGDRT
jgi:hypothetical protein